MREYETMLIINPDLENEEVEKVIDEVKAVIEQNQGADAAVDFWGKRKLEYPIEKKESGHYVVIDFKGEQALIKELGRVLKLRDDVLRFKTFRSEGRR